MNYRPVHHVPGWARKTAKGTAAEVRGESSLVEMSFPSDPFCLPCNNLTPIFWNSSYTKKK